MITEPFPAPPADILRSLQLVAEARAADEAASKDGAHSSRMRLPDDHPRPWDPSSCMPELRPSLWRWSDDVVAWINHEHAWIPKHLIPACWPQHPHIAREVPVLAVMRWDAEIAWTPKPLEDWNRITLPSFLTRTADRLGEGTCRNGGNHAEWPAKAAFTRYKSPEQISDRTQIFCVEDQPAHRLAAVRAT